ncbi:hypothetical protein WICMUC_003611 [Wickerhamomyces mucosus]|uniref:3-oxoacyl-[acyl-carrier-protein] reductase n=1 Tax=Wickerhamomyces mucosus TaxID=1378264 RepID=A0A9P8TCI7_9ASCO|nr:hypothetical protein WICMUC_003611 [Wickerhamomyces mucosus]
MSLIGKTALITGGSKGLGLSIAKGLSKEGANIILLSRSTSNLEYNVKNELNKDYNQIHNFITCDLSKPELIQSSLINYSIFLQNVNILINCAGISQNSILFNTNYLEISKILNINLTSSIILSKLLLKPLILNKPSSIINISSILALKGLKGTSIYSASKSGLIGFTKSLASEIGSKGIRVNCISPGLITDTDMGKGFHYDNALKRQSVDQLDIINTVLFLLNNQSITGQNIVVDNGYLC